jgi:hypothetical protein
MFDLYRLTPEPLIHPWTKPAKPHLVIEYSGDCPAYNIIAQNVAIPVFPRVCRSLVHRVDATRAKNSSALKRVNRWNIALRHDTRCRTYIPAASR